VILGLQNEANLLDSVAIVACFRLVLVIKQLT
jgi:hypothetical protein